MFDGTDRVYQRLPINDRDHRLVITKLGRFNHNSYLAQNNTIINRLNSEYDLQETIRSDFVIRNHKMNILGEAVFFIQEDYDRYLICYIVFLLISNCRTLILKKGWRYLNVWLEEWETFKNSWFVIVLYLLIAFVWQKLVVGITMQK